MKFFIATLLIVTVFFSCKKEMNLSGKITNSITKEPISNLPISLYLTENPSAYGSDEGELIITRSTDENGVFSFSRKYSSSKEKNSTAYLYIANTDSSWYFGSGNYKFISTYNKLNNPKMDAEIAPTGYLT